MADTTSHAKLRVGIAGLDHWYIGLGAAEAAAAQPELELVAIGHRDPARAEETAQRFGAAEATGDIQSLARREDLDILVTACRSSDNPDLCVEAASRGVSIVSTKPVAMTRDGAARIQEAVERAGVRFFSWESSYRLNPSYLLIKRWIEEGRIGRPVSAAYVVRSSLPTQVWPGVQGETWWLDPQHVPGGGWIDHSIYGIDVLRWLFQSEVETAGGLTARLVHRDLRPQMEDFGIATLSFANGQAASLEVTWTAPAGTYLTATQVMGTEGGIMLDSSAPGRASVSGYGSRIR